LLKVDIILKAEIFGAQTMDDSVLVATIREAQTILSRHLAGEHVSADETVNLLLQLFDSTEVIKALADRGFLSEAFK
jgi:hypothetical protein